MKMKKLIIVIIILLYGQNIKSQCYSAGQNLPNSGYILQTSGYAELDKIVFQEIYQLQMFFGVKIDFFYLLESYSANAMYDPRCNFNCNGSVFLGVKMLYNQLQKEHGIECVKAILAHEFGHCVQNLINWTELGKRRELHSDFLSGYYTGKMYNYTDEQMSALYSEFYSMGDNQIWDFDHHGTKIERECAFLEGFYFAKESNSTIQLANTYGIQYVTANNPCAVRKYKAAVQQYQNEIQKRTVQLEKDIKEGNIGSIQFIARDSKKYKVVTINGFGQKVVYPLNQSYIGLNNYGQRAKYQPITEATLSPISANTQVPYSIYKTNWFFGDVLIWQYSAIISRNKTVKISFDINKISFNQ
jgi:hypothetical protein